jgi:hypothetical protein
MHADPHEELSSAAAAAPRGVVHLVDRDRAAAALRRDRDDVPRKLTQEVAARDPRRQHEALLRPRSVDAALDFEAMPVEVDRPDAIMNQSSSLRAANGARILA